MRIIFLLFILSLSFGTIANEPTMMHVPYYPVLADSLSLEDDAKCEAQARLSAKAFQNATKLGITLEQQLKTWDEFVKTEAASKFSSADLDHHRKLIVIAFNLAEKFPDLKPNEYGDYVYESCAYDKAMSPRHKF